MPQCEILLAFSLSFLLPQCEVLLIQYEVLLPLYEIVIGNLLLLCSLVYFLYAGIPRDTHYKVRIS